MIKKEPDLEKAESLIIKTLQTNKSVLSLYDIIDLLKEAEIPDPKRIAKEAIWGMSEEERVSFTNNWSIEIK